MKNDSTIGLSILAEMNKIVSSESHLQMFGKPNVTFVEEINKTASVKVNFHEEIYNIIEKLKKSSELMDSLGLEKTSSSVLEVLNEMINELSIKKIAEIDESEVTKELKEELKRYKKEHHEISPEELEDEELENLEDLYEEISEEEPDLDVTEICPDCGFDHLYEKSEANDWHKAFDNSVEFSLDKFDKDIDIGQAKDSNDISENLFNAMLSLDPDLVPGRNRTIRQMLDISPLGDNLDDKPSVDDEFLSKEDEDIDNFLNPYFKADSDTPLPRPSSIDNLKKDNPLFYEFSPEEEYIRTHETVRPPKKKVDAYLKNWLEKHGEKVKEESEDEEDFEDEDE